MFTKPIPWVHGKNIQALFVLYLLSNMLLLFNTNGIYWDDWVLYNQPFDELQDMMNQLTGDAHLFEYIHKGLSLIGNGVFFYRLSTVILYFLSGIFLYFILLDITYIPRQSTFFITLLFMILPVNSARVALCDFQYGLFLCLFFMAFWLLTHYMNKQGTVFFRVAILALFYLSFFVNSLLVFFSIPLLYILYKIHQRSAVQSLRSNIFTLFTQYIDFICLPIFFYWMKSTYFVPYGLYDHYNALSSNYPTIALDLIQSFKHAFFEPLANALFVSQQFWYLLCVTLIFLMVYLRQKEEPCVFNKSSLMILMSMGLLFFIIGVFPYVAAGKMPVLSSFGSRHMLLIPLGMALILYGFILSIEQKSALLAHILLITLIAVCILKNMHDQTQYLKDWMYQVALEEHYKTNLRIKHNTTFVLDSNISLSNHRGMDFYENNGRLRKVFGDDSRFMGGSLHEIETYANYKQYKRYNFSGWIPSAPLTVTVRKEIEHALTIKPFLTLLVAMLLDETDFRREAKKLITMDVAFHDL